MGLNELMKLYDFLINILALIFSFQRKPILLCDGVQQVDKVYLCKQRWNIFLFRYIWSWIWFLQLSCGIDGLLQLDYSSLYLSLFLFSFVSKLFMLASPCCPMTLSMLLIVLLICCLFYEIIVCYSIQWATEPSAKSMDKHLEEIDHIYYAYRTIIIVWF